MAQNFYDFLMSLSPEIRVEVYTNGIETARKKEHKWVRIMGGACPALKKLYIDLVDVSADLL